MRVLIAGGSGLIGSALARSLLADGNEVTILTRGEEKFEDGAHFVHWDGASPAGWSDELENADAIVNLAGAGIADARWSDERKRLIVESRVDAGKAIVAAIQNAANPPLALVQASAVGYYGVHADEPVTEQTPPGDDFLAETCVAWEESTRAVEALGVRRTIARTGVVLSTKGGALPQLLLPFRMVVAGGPLGSGKQYVPWIHSEDEVRALRFLLESATASGPYNLSAPAPVTNRELADTIGKVMNRPSFLPTPAFALKAALGERATIVLDGQRQVPERLLAEGFHFTWTQVESALRDLINES